MSVYLYMSQVFMKSLKCQNCQQGNVYLEDVYYFFDNCSFLENEAQKGGSVYVYNTSLETVLARSDNVQRRRILGLSY